ncbi:hypothetical protein GCM10027589_01850 [Actinocorallia lasiicapitis]
MFLGSGGTGGWFGGVIGLFVGGLFGIVAVPVIGLTSELPLLIEHIRPTLTRADDSLRLIAVVADAYLKPLSLLRGGSQPQAWPETASTLPVLEQRPRTEEQFAESEPF